MFLETRPQFLLLSPILSFLGMSIALYNGSFNTLYFILAAVGLVLLHASVNTLNDYSDYKTGVDLKTRRTPFSGGSGFLPSRLLKPSTVLKIGLGSIILAAPIGIYFLVERGLQLSFLYYSYRADRSWTLRDIGGTRTGRFTGYRHFHYYTRRFLIFRFIRFHALVFPGLQPASVK